MMFFDFVLKHWIISLVWFVLFTPIVRRFMREIFVGSRVWRVIWDELVEGWESKTFGLVWGIFVYLLLYLPLAILLYPLAPFAWAILLQRDAKLKVLEAKEHEQRRRDAEDRRRRTQEENTRRQESFAEWRSHNKLRIFYNTVDDFTVATSEKDYLEAQRWTAARRLDGEWKHANILKPGLGHPSYLFVTRQGLNALNDKFDRSFTSYKVAGLQSKLHEVAEHYDIELVEAKDLFIPWMSEGVLNYNQQSQLFPDGGNRDMYTELGAKQIPSSFRQLPIF